MILSLLTPTELVNHAQLYATTDLERSLTEVLQRRQGYIEDLESSARSSDDAAEQEERRANEAESVIDKVRDLLETEGLEPDEMLSEISKVVK